MSSYVTKSQIVYVEELTAGEVLDYKMEVTSASMEDTDDNDSEEDEHLAVRGNILSPLYNIAMYLKEIIKNAKGIGEGVWPPVSTDLTTQGALNSVPTELFNFITWITGCSSEPELEKKVEIPDEMKSKVLALAQDLIYISSKGKTQTHKSLTLGMAVRQLTRSKKLIDILSGFGHCVSSTTVINHETALAIVNSKDTVDLPVGVIPDRFTTFVYDNADFNEETLSGKGSTHVANGICIQRTNQYDTTAAAARNISKKIRRLDAPSNCLEEFHLGKRGVPQVKEHCDTIQIESGISESEGRARKLDFCYIICKIITDGHNTTLSSWTAFNTVLDKNIKGLSSITYLPVINAPITEVSTVYNILKKCVMMTDKLNLQYAVVVFDEAVYCKAQMIRWKDEELLSRLVIRLGDFHMVMSYCSGIAKLFKDGGLQVMLRYHTRLYNRKTCRFM